jgi:aldehyde:ferredoxin oxidoreductase
MECFDRGLLTTADTGGIEIRWGDGPTVLKTIDLIAKREGPLGELLADGALAAARRIGRNSEQYVVHVKGLEVAMHDPRGMQRMLENYPVTPTGGDHTGGAHQKTSIRNTIGLCIFLGYDDERTLDLVRAATGWDLDDQELRTVVSRGLSMARLFNLREGMTTEADGLPQRLHEPLLKGPLSDKHVTRAEVRDLVQDYYRSQGWHPESGAPLNGTLEALDIANYSAYARDVAVSGEGGAMLPPLVLAASAVPQEQHSE